MPMTVGQQTDTPQTGKTYHHGNLRFALLDAADAELEAHGLQGFTLRGCARRAGVSHAAPKHHFGDTRGLLTAIATRGFDRLRAALEAAAGATDPAERLRENAATYAAFAAAQPEHFRIMFRSDLLEHCDEALIQAMLSTYGVMTNLITHGRGEPNIQVGGSEHWQDPDFLADLLLGWTFIHGYAHLLLEQQLNVVPDQLHGEVIKRVSARIAGVLSIQYTEHNERG